MSVKCNYCQSYDKEYPNPKCINCRSGFNDDMNKPDYFECKFCNEYNLMLKIQQNEHEETGLDYINTIAVINEIYKNGQSKGRGTHYTWLPINYCPCCGMKYE